MIHIGIDLGLSGAVALLNDNTAPEVHTMPVVESTKGRKLLDLSGIMCLLSALGPKFVVMERLQTLPKFRTQRGPDGAAVDKPLGGGNANFSRGYSLGALEGLLVARGIPY